MESIGAKLSSARTGKGVSVEQAARDTHIAKRFIEALEQERFDEFPGEAYLLGFLRNYAGYLGLSSEDVVTLYHNIRLQEQPAPIDELLDNKPKGGGFRWVILAIGALVVIAGVVTVFATGVITLPERPERPRTEEPAETVAAPLELQDQFVERRFAEGDQVAVPVDGETAILEFLTIGDGVSVGSEAGIVQIAAGEERTLDLTGEGSGDVRMAVRRIYADDDPPGVVVRLDRVVNRDGVIQEEPAPAMTDADIADLGTGMTNDPDRERSPVAITEFAAIQEYFIEADFRGLTMFRWEVDDEEREERYLQNGDRIRTSVTDVVRVWASNAGNVRLRVAGVPVELGDQGEVVAAVIRWRERDSGAWALELLPMY